MSDSQSCLMAIDTATQACSISICRGNALLVENTTMIRQTHSRHLLTLIHNAFDLVKMTPSDLDGFVVTKGPGSFTGLRIGISTAKGLAFSVNKPLVGVSYLESLAWQSALTPGMICALIDARRGEYYYALYRFDDSGLHTVVPESVGSFSSCLAKIELPCLFVGNAVNDYRMTIVEKLGQEAVFASDFCNILRGDTIVGMGRRLFSAGHCNQLESLVPKYIRKSDAQINFKKNAQGIH